MAGVSSCISEEIMEPRLMVGFPLCRAEEQKIRIDGGVGAEKVYRGKRQEKEERKKVIKWGHV